MSDPLPATLPTGDRRSTCETATLLYVEDTLSNLQLVKLALDFLRPRWRLLAAQDGHDGLRLARERHPDLILLNLHLPGMGGDVVLTQLRTDPATSHIPVLLLSGDATPQSRERLLALGASDYLPKPFNVYALADKLDRLWEDHRGDSGS